VWGATTTFYVYDALGRLAAEYSKETPTSTGTSYLFTDMLGSTRAITSKTGAMTECYDYLPFGRMLSTSDNGRSSIGCLQSNPDAQITSNASQKFTGKERDQETGLDYFLARYYSGAQGRFLSPDPENEGAVYQDPQTWNAYSYVRNNPINATDPECIGRISRFFKTRALSNHFQFQIKNIMSSGPRSSDTITWRFYYRAGSRHGKICRVFLFQPASPVV
jgi:RHS repeat-associated protein